MGARPSLGRFKARAHTLDAQTLYVSDRLHGHLLSWWAVAVGVFIMLGGPNGFRNDTYATLLDVFGSCPKLVGVSLTICGVIMVVSIWFNWVMVSQIGYALGAIWHFAFFGYTLPPNLGILGHTNLISPAMAFIGFFYAIQIWTTQMRKGSRNDRNAESNR